MTIEELYKKQVNYWKKSIQEFFGVTPLSSDLPIEKINESLEKDSEKFYNNGTCEYKRILTEDIEGDNIGHRCKDIDIMIPNTWNLRYNDLIGKIELSASFKIESCTLNNEEIVKEERHTIAFLPLFTELGFEINKTKYVMRITANRNNNLISCEYKNSNVVERNRKWKFNKTTREMTLLNKKEDPFKSLDKINTYYLEALLGGKKLTEENFYDALCLVKPINRDSVFNYYFEYEEKFFNHIRNGKAKSSIKKEEIDVPSQLTRLKKNFASEDDEYEQAFTNLVLCSDKNNIFILENSRTVVYLDDNNKNPYANRKRVNFDNCSHIFDAFKTSTNKAAGRSRLLLDDAFVKDGIIWATDKNGKEFNMFELELFDNINYRNNVSAISYSLFSENNAPKRIMMNAKLRTQAVPIEGEEDIITHDIPARIVFGDFEGFNFGDSIIISRSFARKLLAHYKNKNIMLDSRTVKIAEKYKPGDEIPLEDLYNITNSNYIRCARNIRLIDKNDKFIKIDFDVPFSVGDKITNLHGSKGIVSIILPDDKMPYLENYLGPNMPKGYFDIIVSAISVYKRKSLGQIFEAWASASGITDVSNFMEAKDKYSNEMKEYCEKSVISFNGIKTIKPCGINKFIRLDHNASSKQSFSKISTNGMIKLGEQECLCLAAMGAKYMLNEFDIRSLNKHFNAKRLIKEVQKTGILPLERANNLNIFNILQCLGIDISLNLNNEYLEKDNDDGEFSTSIISDNEIDLF